MMSNMQALPLKTGTVTGPAKDLVKCLLPGFTTLVAQNV
jgi:hypothetical protein